MIKNSVGIVLKRFPYSETSLIARCFVKDLGKVSFLVHGAHRKKSPMSAYFQPANCLNLVFYFKESRELQTISKASFNHSWSNISKDLKKRGFKFVGATVIYAYMQAVGMVNDHTTGCFKYQQ